MPDTKHHLAPLWHLKLKNRSGDTVEVQTWSLGWKNSARDHCATVPRICASIISIVSTSYRYLCLPIKRICPKKWSVQKGLPTYLPRRRYTLFLQISQKHCCRNSKSNRHESLVFMFDEKIWGFCSQKSLPPILAIRAWPVELSLWSRSFLDRLSSTKFDWWSRWLISTGWTQPAAELSWSRSNIVHVVCTYARRPMP